MKKLLALFLILILTGCHQANHKGSTWPIIEAIEKPTVSDEQQRRERWLNQLSEVMAMSPEQLQKTLKRLGTRKPKATDPLFHYALLNQQLKDRLGWIRARDSLRLLKADKRVTGELQVLVEMLLLHNQSMINADARDGRLLEALEQNQQALQLSNQALSESHIRSQQLQEKINALTNLEQSMSIRRALTTDAEKGSSNE